MPKRIRRSLDDADDLGNTSDRDEHGRFARGNRASVGNRSNAERGEIRAAIRRAVTSADFDAIVRRMMLAAKNGSVQAASWISDRMDGKPRTEPDDQRAPIELPDLADLESCAAAQRAIMRAVSRSEVSIEAAERLSALVTATADRLRDVDLEARIAELEQLQAMSEPDWSG